MTKATFARRGVKITLVGATVVLLAASAALAYYTVGASATGSTDTQVETAQSITMTAVAVPSSLYPTGTAIGDVRTSVYNPNAFSVKVGSIALDTSQGTNGFASSEVAPADCALSFTTQTNGGNGFDLPASVTNLDLNDSLTMGTGAAPACQGATFTVYLKIL